MNSKYHPLSKYINRDPEIIEIVEDFSFQMQNKMKQKPPKRNYKKKKFVKKNDKEAIDDFNKQFPALDGSKVEKTEVKDG